ncbi:hypothetical protein NAU58_00785 [Pseudomonas stutzeri]|uniref:Uncharacterized protein n=1 Tax=Stutzerimonas stutzeri TaxID=316 RepID=A0A2N8S4I4_STUST|nr:hypothetical protein [Stutzerimonas stutzeri]MCQ4294098.1 hypothetical protein [Stutzerimonas stutzeri]PNF81509.1 hypothetical protein CXK92_06655 [Stutzerimonas stutzeri]
MTLPISASIAAARHTARTGVPARSAAEAEQVSESPSRTLLNERSRERLLSAAKATRSLSNSMREADSAKKEAARRRIEDIKERIKMLRMLVSGGLASKGVLREIRELAKALGQAAKVLGDSGGDTKQAGTGEGAAPATAGSAEQSGLQGEAASLPQEAAQEDDADKQPEATKEDGVDEAASRTAMTLKLYLENLQQARQDEQPSAAETRQRGADAELIEDAVRRLKALLALVKSVRDTDDPDSRERISEVKAQLDDSEKIARGLGSGFAAAPLSGVSVSISV